MVYNGRMFQFNIRSLMILTAAVAVIVWVLFAPPQIVGTLVLLGICLMVPTTVLSGIIYQRGYWRAFFIGAAPATAGLFLSLSVFVFDAMEDGDWLEIFVQDSNNAVEMKLALAPPLALIALSGLTGMAIRWWANRSASTAAQER